MNKYQQFIFKDYSFDRAQKSLKLYYSFDDQLNFQEIYTFNFEFIDYDPEILEKALFDLFIMAGISYFKGYIPLTIRIDKNSLNEFRANFFNKIYQKGLGEFWYVNNLDPNTNINFPFKEQAEVSLEVQNNSGILVGIGGGKDSLLVVEALQNLNLDFMTWSLNHQEKLKPLINRIGTKHLYVDRVIDPKLLELNKLDALNGHIPISAIIGFVGVIVAILSGNQDIVVGNEHSASEPNLTYRGVLINHQYSKSIEFESDLQQYLKANYQDSIRYYSFLRSLSELRIAEIFAKTGFNKYSKFFSSCNRAFRLDHKELYWCGECPKCAFIFMLFRPFIEERELIKLWNGKNLLLEKSLEPIYQELLGIKGSKPLDCVGEIKEARAAMRLCQEIYPSLKNKYVFDLPLDYDYRTIWNNLMPEDINSLFQKFITQF